MKDDREEGWRRRGAGRYTGRWSSGSLGVKGRVFILRSLCPFSSLFHSLLVANELLMAVEMRAMDQSSIFLCFFLSLPPFLPPSSHLSSLFALSLLLASWQGPSLAGSDSPPSLFVSRFQETERQA